MARAGIERRKVEGLASIYLNALEQHQAGWQSESVLAAIAEAEGDVIPKAKSWRASDLVLNQSQRVRKAHALLARAVFIFGRVRPEPDSELGLSFAGGVLKSDYSLPVIASVFYRGENVERIADKLGLSPDAYQYRTSKGIQEAAKEISSIELLEQLLSASTSELLI